MSKHTPGPWTLEDHGYKFIVSKPGDGYITRDVCRMDASTMAAFAQEANARLIAAAPEQNSALIGLLELVEELDCLAASNDPRAIAAHAAVAKVQGEKK